MTNSIPPFTPGDYPRTYKCRSSTVLHYFVAAVIVLFPVFVGPASRITLLPFVAGLVFVVTWIVWEKSKKLTLKRDAIEYSTLLSKRSIHRGDIKGVQCNFLNDADSYPDEIIFISKMEDMKPIHVSLNFKADALYDAWVADLPFLGGTYKGSPVNEGEAYYNAIWHVWVPGGRKRIAEIVASSNKVEIDNPGLAIAERRRLESKTYAARQLRGTAVFAFLVAGIMGVIGLLCYSGASALQNHGLRTTGKLTKVVAGAPQLTSYPNYGGVYRDYYAIIETDGTKGAPHRFKVHIDSSLNDYLPGDQVTVLYLPQQPDDAIIDRGADENLSSSRHMLEFALSMLLLGMGLRLRCIPGPFSSLFR